MAGDLSCSCDNSALCPFLFGNHLDKRELVALIVFLLLCVGLCLCSNVISSRCHEVVYDLQLCHFLFILI